LAVKVLALKKQNSTTRRYWSERVMNLKHAVSPSFMKNPGMIKNDFDEIPIIDLGKSLSDNPEALAATIREICHKVGFFIVTNHGVPKKVVSDTFQLGKTIFGLPLEQKQLIDKRQSPYFRGWEAEGSEFTNNNPDIREQVDLWSEHAPRDGNIEPAYLRLLGPNQWLPDAVLPNSQKVMTRWFDETGNLANKLMSLLGIGLGFSADYFENRFGEERMSLTKLIRYPKTPQGSFGVNAHHDSGFLTVLAAGDTPGLEILNAADKWIPVPVIPDAFVINIGEMLQAVTGNYYIATSHRVFSNAERYSLGYFHGPSLESNLSQVDLKPEFVDAVQNSPRHSSAGFMASAEDTKGGVKEMSGGLNASTYGDQLWSYFKRSYPENMKKHHPDVE
jgi:isopenicillin N synthase-like dioxygenase